MPTLVTTLLICIFRFFFYSFRRCFTPFQRLLQPFYDIEIARKIIKKSSLAIKITYQDNYSIQKEVGVTLLT